MSYHDTLSKTLESLPKTKETEIWRNDPAVYSFINYIMRKGVNNESLLPVIDEMFIYYSRLNRDLIDELHHIKQRLTPADMARLYEGYDYVNKKKT